MTTAEWDALVAAACRDHGALAVSRAATQAMEGRAGALVQVGLHPPLGAELVAAMRAQALAYRLADPQEQAADTTEAVIALAKLPRHGGAPPPRPDDLAD